VKSKKPEENFPLNGKREVKRKYAYTPALEELQIIEINLKAING
jgi:hypothetical protein